MDAIPGAKEGHRRLGLRGSFLSAYVIIIDSANAFDVLPYYFSAILVGGSIG